MGSFYILIEVKFCVNHLSAYAVLQHIESTHQVIQIDRFKVDYPLENSDEGLSVNLNHSVFFVFG